MNNKMKQPIKSQKEADDVFESLVRISMSTLNISREQSEKRIRALLNSGLLEGGNPNNIESKKLIDKFMQTPI